MNKKLLLIIFSFFVASSLVSCGTNKPNRKVVEPKQVRYSMMEVKRIESQTFKRTNSFDYPNNERELYDVDPDYAKAVNKFANKIYFNRKDDGINYSFSPFNLYTNLSLDSLACSNEKATQVIDELLCCSRDLRDRNFKRAFLNDFYCNESGTTQMYQGIFQANRLEPNKNFIKAATDYFAETYQMDFLKEKDIKKMLDWVDSKINEKNFLKIEDLGDLSNTIMLIFSTLYFNNQWYTVFNNANSYKDKFYVDATTTVEAEYMHHEYFGYYFDHGDFCSFYDYYKNGMKIKYLVPKNYTKLNIFDLTKDFDIFKKEDDFTGQYREEYTIKLDAPKFKAERMIDFSDELRALGCEYLFDENSHAFDDAFENLNPNSSVYLGFVKQKNKVSFDETGTVIKSVTISGFPEKGDPGIFTEVNIKLDCPFIYIIYDNNDLPIYCGNVNNPIL